MMKYEYMAVLNFWFSPQNVPKHFKSDFAFDTEITFRFQPVYEAVCSGMLDEWKQKPESLLALIIVLEQFPRNMFRGKAQMFATDAQARDLSQLMLKKGWDKKLAYIQRPFVYLPLEHSESMNDQKRSLEEFQTLGDTKMLEYAKRHYDTIRRFGRFPARNAILGRKNTSKEQAFLNENPVGF